MGFAELARARRPRETLRLMRTWGSGRVLFPTAVALAGAPIAVATLHAIRMHWTAAGDDAVIATRALDVFSDHSPLVGQWSQASSITGHPTYSPGPLLYWLLAIPSRLGPLEMAVTMGAVNLGSVVGVVALARRQGGPLFMVGVAAALVITCRSLPVEIPYEIWNTWAGIFPFLLLMFVSWAIGSGAFRLLPLGVVLASFVVQCDLAYVAPAVACAAVAVLGLVLWRRTEGRAGDIRPWVALSAVVAVVCWSPAILQELRHGPGNLSRVVALAVHHHETVGLTTGWHTLTESVGVLPLWLKPTLSLEQRYFLGHATGATHEWSTALILAAVVALLLLSVRQREHEIAVAMGLNLALCGSIVAAAGSVPAENLGVAAKAYVLVWTVPAGMFVWTSTSLAAWRAAAPAYGRLHPPRVGLELAAVAICAVAVVAASARDYRDRGRFPPGSKDYLAMRATNASVLDAIAGRRDILIADDGAWDTTFERSLVYSLRLHGLLPSVRGPYIVTQLGSAYRAGTRAHGVTVTVAHGAAPVPHAGRVVVRNREVTVSIAVGVTPNHN
jgi:hypothetical protein